MKFYHGTSEENWEKIKEEGILYGRRYVLNNDGTIHHEIDRCTYLATNKEETDCHKEEYCEIPVVKVNDDCPLQPITLPCWSLYSLLDVIPKRIGDYNRFRMDISDKDFSIWYDEIGCGVNNKLPDITMKEPVDACCENDIKVERIKFVVIMKLIVKIVDWVKKETWWRKYYKRITIDEETTWGGRCLQCHAGTTGDNSLRCSIIDGRDCPCKYNQCLKLK